MDKELYKQVHTESYDIYKKYGIHKSELLYNVYNEFYFPDDLKPCLDKYYLIYWNTKYFLERLNYGTIRDVDALGDSVVYQVIYYKCNPATLKALAKSQPTRKIKLSFRIVNSKYKILPTVLVKIG